MDDIFDEAQLLNLKERYPEAVEISVTTGQGLEGLKKKITDIIIFDK